MNGVLVIDKPKGWTSHDVVARVRRTLKVKKAGHGGTLDPLATGVLPVYLGEGTKLVPFNLDGIKEYRATLRLGQETDTLDADGRITREEKDFSCSREALETASQKFEGVIRQTPPLFSALKLGGRPLYRRARAGERPEVAEREVRVHSISLQEFRFPLATLAIACGRGTYIRSLCADLGRELGCGAHVVELRRLRSGKFTLDQATELERLPWWMEQGRLGERILSLQEGVELSGEIRLGKKAAEKVRQGRPLHWGDLPAEEGKRLKRGERIGLFEVPETLLAIAEAQLDGISESPGNPRALRILRVFHG